MDSSKKSMSLLRLAVAWTIVTIPLGWGVFQSVMKSLPLFQANAATASSPKK